MSSAGELLRRGSARLRGLPGIDPALDAHLLLMKATGWSEARLWTGIDRDVPPAVALRFLKLVARRRARTPLAYLTGEKEFWSLGFRVFPGVLIPRPETEILVEAVLGCSSRRPETIVEIGTGSGCVAIVLALELPAARILAVDRSRRALRAARLNAARHDAAAVSWHEGNFFEPLAGLVRAGRVDLVASNPPYVPEAEWAGLEPEVRDHEPKRALAAGLDGLDFIRRLTAESRTYLRRGGSLVFEIGAGQAGPVGKLFGTDWEPPVFFPDLAGIPRVVLVRRR